VSECHEDGRRLSQLRDGFTFTPGGDSKRCRERLASEAERPRTREKLAFPDIAEPQRGQGPDSFAIRRRSDCLSRLGMFSGSKLISYNRESAYTVSNLPISVIRAPSVLSFRRSQPD
jgi:hypothetical protein